MSEESILDRRRAFNEQRLNELHLRITEIPELKKFNKLSIYVTGSYGRLEANSRSDLDLFFISESTPPSKLSQTLIDADIIRIVRDLKMPDFSNDAQYLQVHCLPEILKELGGNEDDYKNFFTARLLLLLESRPVFGEDSYSRIVNAIIEAYFRDYHDHVADFRPIFLVNDILRYWKTLCLNHEKKRNIPASAQDEKNKHHLRNFKLKFSRLLTCFGTVIPLSTLRPTSPSEIFRLTEIPPLDRLQSVSSGSSKAFESFNKIKEEYGWFLDQTGDPNLQNNIGDRDIRRSLFRRADQFGYSMFTLLSELLKDTDRYRFLII